MKRFEVWLARLDPSEGSEMQKTRPVAVLSPDVMNVRLHTVIVAPLTAGGFLAPFRVPCQFGHVNGQIALDHLRALDKTRLLRRLGILDQPTSEIVLKVLAEINVRRVVNESCSDCDVVWAAEYLDCDDAGVGQSAGHVRDG